MLSPLSTAGRVAELVAARKAQPLLSTCLWLRHGISLDVAPADALAIVAGTEEGHGVPEPLSDAGGHDVERRSSEASRARTPSHSDQMMQRPGMRQASATTTSAVRACAHVPPRTAHGRQQAHQGHGRQQAQAGLTRPHQAARRPHTAQRRRALRQTGWTRAANGDR